MDRFPIPKEHDVEYVAKFGRTKSTRVLKAPMEADTFIHIYEMIRKRDTALLFRMTSEFIYN